VHRGNSLNSPISLERTFVTLAGGIQPDLLPSIHGKYDGGLLERFLLCGKPETGLPPWSDETIDPDLDAQWHLIVAALLQGERARYHGPKDRCGYVPFTKEAYERLRKLYEDLQDHLRQIGVPVQHHGVVRKLVANAGRLALIRRGLRWATGEFGCFGPVGRVEEADCDTACRAAEFFLSRYLLWMPQLIPSRSVAAEAVRQGDTTAAVDSVDMDLATRILEYAASKGLPELSVRWLRQRTLTGNPTTASIRAALDAAVSRGQGRWKDTKKDTFVLE
jgi:hypothetical protein